MPTENAFSRQDVYDFFGLEIEITSNSEDILDFVQSVYARFYKEVQKDVGQNAGMQGAGTLHVIRITDNLPESNEIIIKSMSGSYFLKCKSLNAFDDGFYATVPDPLSYIQWIVLKDFSLLLKDYQLIHAAAVSMEENCMIFPAFSGFGKTTLAFKLVQNGFKFLSDELACLRRDTQIVEPFYRKINFDDDACRLLGLPPLPDSCKRVNGSGKSEWIIDIEDIFPSSLSSPCVLRYVVFLLGFGEKPRLEKIAKSNALFKLFGFSFSPINDRAELLYTFAPHIEGADCYNLVLGNPDETVDLIQRFLDDHKAEQES